MINAGMIEVANFELINLDWFTDWLYDDKLDEDDRVNQPFNASWEECGYESLLVITNMGLLLWVFFLYTLLLVAFAMLVCLEKTVCCCCECIMRLRLKLQQKLIWNTFIRLFLEMYADMAITAFLNVHTADWDSPSDVVRYSNTLAVVFLAILCLVPLALICIHKSNWQLVQQEEF